MMQDMEDDQEDSTPRDSFVPRDRRGRFADMGKESRTDFQKRQRTFKRHLHAIPNTLESAAKSYKESTGKSLHYMLFMIDDDSSYYHHVTSELLDPIMSQPGIVEAINKVSPKLHKSTRGLFVLRDVLAQQLSRAQPSLVTRNSTEPSILLDGLNVEQLRIFLRILYRGSGIKKYEQPDWWDMDVSIKDPKIVPKLELIRYCCYIITKAKSGSLLDVNVQKLRIQVEEEAAKVVAFRATVDYCLVGYSPQTPTGHSREEDPGGVMPMSEDFELDEQTGNHVAEVSGHQRRAQLKGFAQQHDPSAYATMLPQAYGLARNPSAAPQSEGLEDISADHQGAPIPPMLQPELTMRDLMVTVGAVHPLVTSGPKLADLPPLSPVPMDSRTITTATLRCGTPPTATPTRESPCPPSASMPAAAEPHAIHSIARAPATNFPLHPLHPVQQVTTQVPATHYSPPPLGPEVGVEPGPPSTSQADLTSLPSFQDGLFHIVPFAGSPLSHPWPSNGSLAGEGLSTGVPAPLLDALMSGRPLLSVSTTSWPGGNLLSFDSATPLPPHFPALRLLSDSGPSGMPSTPTLSGAMDLLLNPLDSSEQLPGTFSNTPPAAASASVQLEARAVGLPMV